MKISSSLVTYSMTNGSSEPQLLVNNVFVKRYNNYFRQAIWKTLSLMQNTQYDIFPIRKNQSISTIKCNHALCVVVHQYVVLMFYNPLQSKEERKTYYSKLQDAKCLFVKDGFP